MTSANADKLGDDKSEDEISKKCDAAKQISAPPASQNLSSEFISATMFEHETSQPDEAMKKLSILPFSSSAKTDFKMSDSRH
jgi:hypothetical protein